MMTLSGIRSCLALLLAPAGITAPDHGRALGSARLEAFGQGVRAVIADMSRTRFCDSSGIRYLLLASDRAAELNAEFRLVVQSTTVLRAFGLLGIDRLLAVYPSMEAALSNAAVAAKEEPGPTR